MRAVSSPIDVVGFCVTSMCGQTATIGRIDQGCQRTIAIADGLGPEIRSRFPNPPNRNFNLRFDMAPVILYISMRYDLRLKHP